MFSTESTSYSADNRPAPGTSPGEMSRSGGPSPGSSEALTVKKISADHALAALLPVARSAEEDAHEQVQERSARSNEFQPVFTPADLVTFLNRFIAGNEAAKKSLGITFYEHQLRIKYVPGVPAVEKILRDHFDRGNGYSEQEVHQLYRAIAATLRANPISRRNNSVARKDICDLLKLYEKQALISLKTSSRPRPQPKKSTKKTQKRGKAHSQKGSGSATRPHSGVYTKVIDSFVRDRRNGEQRLKELQIRPEEARNTPLLIGQTGSGKTTMVKLLANKLKLPFVYIDASGLTEASYHGTDASSVPALLLKAARKMLPRASKADLAALASKGIVFLDEIDKKAWRGEAGTENSRKGAQANLLSLLDGFIDHETGVDLRTVQFIAAGSFTGEGLGDRTRKSDGGLLILDIVKRRLNIPTFGFAARPPTTDEQLSTNHNKLLSQVLPPDLNEFGLIAELAGRMTPVGVDFVTRDLLLNILSETSSSPIRQVNRKFLQHGIDLRFTDEALQLIAEAALRWNMGARPLHHIVRSIFEDLAFRAPELAREAAAVIRCDEEFIRARLIKKGLLPAAASQSTSSASRKVSENK